MRVLPSLTVAALIATAFVGAPARAWTGPTRVRMIDDATKLMPPTLRTVLERRREAVLRGMLLPMTREDDPAHRPPSEGGSLDAAVDAARRELIDAANAHLTFDEIARRFGALAHFVADAGFPPGAGGSSGDRRYAHFAAFCESRRPRIPLVFYGHDNEALARGDFRAFTAGVLSRARAQDTDLARSISRVSRKQFVHPGRS
jgi:hypothetical protein